MKILFKNIPVKLLVKNKFKNYFPLYQHKQKYIFKDLAYKSNEKYLQPFLRNLPNKENYWA